MGQFLTIRLQLLALCKLGGFSQIQTTQIKAGRHFENVDPIQLPGVYRNHPREHFMSWLSMVIWVAGRQ